MVNAVLYENQSFIIVPAERSNQTAILLHNLISKEMLNDVPPNPRLLNPYLYTFLPSTVSIPDAFFPVCSVPDTPGKRTVTPKT